MFRTAWALLRDSQELANHEFVVKADADTVFFPDRLRSMLQYHNAKVWFTNCRFWAGNNGVLYGSFELFSYGALQEYFEHPAACNGLDAKVYGEDHWMQQCMETMKIPVDTSLISHSCDNYCNRKSPCSDKTKVSFHPHKDIQSWMACHNQGVR